MMIPEQIDYIVKRITYKQGWTIKLVQERSYIQDDDTFSIHVKALLPDVNSSKIVSIQSSTIIDPWAMGSEKRVIDFIMQCIMDLEMHEVKEYFKIDGINHVDPHPELAPPKLTVKKKTDIPEQCKHDSLDVPLAMYLKNPTKS